MSGLTIQDQTQPVAPKPPSAESATAVEDAAASLRLKALSTLKRRKNASNNDSSLSLPSRQSTSDNTILLDYGSEEPSAGTSTSASASTVLATVTTPKPAPPPPTPPSVSQPTPAAMDVDEDQTREEGEISDSEGPPPPTKSPQVTSSAIAPKPQQSISQPPRKPSPPPQANASSPIKTEALPHPLPGISLSLAPGPRQPTPPPDHDMAIDESQIRPGLNMTQAQYDTAKDIVLDLLGWGVPPEYLVDCGLSREIVFHVFVEFNLRLPGNLDATGLPLPPQLQDVHFASPEPLSPQATLGGRQRSQSSAGPSRAPTGHPSLPQKPSAPQGTTTDGPTLSATASPFIPAGSISATPMQLTPPTLPTSLIDMEQQKRQELRARKAVLASRKSKQAGTASSSARPSLESRITEATDIIMASAVQKEDVDDFLKSIGAVESTEPAKEHSDEMEVDGVTSESAVASLSTQPIPSRSPSIREPSISDTVSPNSPTFPTSEAGSSSGSVRKASIELDTSGRSQSRPDDKSDVSEPYTPRELSAGPRRGTKRPVAADFVDMDANSYHYHYGNGHGHGHYPRKRPQSFAGLTGPRRVVIDLSDSEEDDDSSHWHTHHHHSRQSTRLAAASSAPTIGSPAALLEKEQEIKKMKELIAQRERARLDKLAANSNRSTPPATTINTDPGKPPPVPVKEEEDESAASASLRSMPPASSQSMEQTTNGRHSPPALTDPSSSTSGLITPTDEATHTTEISITGDKETRQEQVARAPSPIKPRPLVLAKHNLAPVFSMDVDDVSSYAETPSAQDFGAQQDTPRSDYAAYRSPLSLYPFLHAHSRPYLIDFEHSISSGASELFAPLDRRPGHSDLSLLTGVNLRALKAIAVNKWLSDPSRRVCQYEVPGGGECRDRDCADIHPSLAWTVEPSDEETAQHLFAALPKGSQVTLQQLQSALQEARQPDVGYHMRVKEALSTLGLRTGP